MDRRPTPQEKKRLDYERQHFPHAEYPHAYRKSRPRKKAFDRRKTRRRAERLVRGVTGDAAEVLARADDESLTEAHVRRARRGSWFHKAPLRTLRERVRDGLATRELVDGRTRFRRAYDPAKRSAYEAFLTARMRGRTERTRALAAHFRALLDPPAPHDIGQWRGTPMFEKRQWLEGFLRDAPEWEGRLRRWIEAQEADETG